NAISLAKAWDLLRLFLGDDHPPMSVYRGGQTMSRWNQPGAGGPSRPQQDPDIPNPGLPGPGIMPPVPGAPHPGDPPPEPLPPQPGPMQPPVPNPGNP